MYYHEHFDPVDPSQLRLIQRKPLTKTCQIDKAHQPEHVLSQELKLLI